jgi:hypothetical protein
VSGLLELECQPDVLQFTTGAARGAIALPCDAGLEIDNNIAENAMRGVALGRKTPLFAGADSGGTGQRRCSCKRRSSAA